MGEACLLEFYASASRVLFFNYPEKWQTFHKKTELCESLGSPLGYGQLAVLSLKRSERRGGKGDSSKEGKVRVLGERGRLKEQQNTG